MPALRYFPLLLVATLVAGRSATAAVVVLKNQSARTVQCTIEGGWNQSQRVSIAPTRLIVVPAPGKLRLTLEGEKTEPCSLVPNAIYQFIGEPVELKPMTFGQPPINGWNASERPAAPPAPVVVPVKVLAEATQFEKKADWEPAIRRQLAAASQILEMHCGVRFDLVATGTWTATAPATVAKRLRDEFCEKVDPSPGWLAIGLAQHYRAEYPSQRQELARGSEKDRGPFFSHLMLPSTGKNFSEEQQLEQLVHDLGHWLGAVHSDQADSVMFPPQLQPADGDGNFDPINALVLNLYADELRAGNRRSVEAMPRPVREHLQAVYLEMAMRLPADRDIPRYADLVREPVLPAVRYVAQWTDGARTVSDTVAPWSETRSAPKIAGRELLDPKNHVRWLLDNATAPAAPEQWIEFVGGDRLPGVVAGYQEGNESPKERLPPHLLVVPQQRVDWPDGAARQHLRVTIPWIRRIVIEPTTEEYRPRTVFCTDGRQLGYRSIRFTADGVQLLRTEGVQDVPLDSIAELHMPPVDPWDAYYEQLAALAPEPSARLVRYETALGMRATGTTERFQARAYGQADKSSSWNHLVHPAWSLDAFWLPHDAIRTRQYFLPHEVSLSRIEPRRIGQQSDLGGYWPWQADRNVEGGMLEVGGASFPWGFGIHGASELEFPLTPAVRSFRTRFGLDQLAGNGGCVRASVAAGTTTLQPLFTSPVIVGSADLADTGRLAFSKPPARLVLSVDPLKTGGPPGSDPLDIRDSFDWIEPLVELDPETIQAEVLRRGPKLIPCWNKWTVTTGDAPIAKLVSVWDEYTQPVQGYRLMVSAAGGPLRLSGKTTPRPYRDRLVIAVSRPPNVPGSRLEVRLDGRPLQTFDVPVRQSSDSPPLVVSLAEFHGRKVAIDLIQLSPDEKAVVQWRAISLVGRTEVP